MSYFNTYLDELLSKKGLKNDSELAKFLDVSRQHLSRVRKGSLFSEEKCYLIATELGIDPLELLSYNMYQKAKSEELKTIWLDLHQKTKKVKAYVLLNSNG